MCVTSFVKELTNLTSCIMWFLIQMHADWETKFGKHLGKKVVLLTGETGTDLPMLRTVCDMMTSCDQPSGEFSLHFYSL